MNSDTLKIINEIAKDIVLLANIIMEDDSISSNTKINKNTLTDSRLKHDIKSRIDIATEQILIETRFNHYIVFLEWTRPPKYGKQPPISALRDWALSRGIPTDNSTLFLIARAIWRDGHKGRPILATLEKEIESKFENEWFDRLFNSTINELTEYFN